MKKLLPILILTFFVVPTAFANKWEYACLDTEQKAVYIDSESVIDAGLLLNFGVPYFCALVKRSDGGLFYCGFTSSNGSKFIYPVSISGNVANLMNLPSVAEQQQKHYDDLRSVGLSPRLAKQAANQMHDEYRENNVKQLLNGLSYGLNSDNSINPIGIGILCRMMSENPTMVEMYKNNCRIAINFEPITIGSPADKIYDLAFRYRVSSAYSSMYR